MKFEKTVLKFTVQQSFRLFNMPAIEYEIEFIQGIFWRRIKVPDLIRKSGLLQSSELYPFMILPWLKGCITEDILLEKGHLVLGGHIKNSNVITKPKSFWSKSTENQNGV